MLPIPPGRPSSAHHKGQDCKGLELSLDSQDEPSRWDAGDSGGGAISSCPSGPGEPPLQRSFPGLALSAASRYNEESGDTHCQNKTTNFATPNVWNPEATKKIKTLRKHLVCVFFIVHIIWYLLLNAIAIYIYIYIYIIPISGWLAQVKPHIGGPLHD